MSATITVHPVSSRRGIRTFIDLPRSIYADDPVWVPHLDLERRIHFSGLNPFFKHAEWQGWIAYRDNQPAGRISAQVDQLHRQQYVINSGHFGLFECRDDPEVAAALFRAAEDWLKKRGTNEVTGPFNFSINQDCGILVEGFDTPPVIMMPHSRPWYGSLLEGQGYAPAKDLLAYRINADYQAPEVLSKLVGRYSSRVRLRPINRKEFGGELEILRDIFNDAWSQNWGFVPFTQEEFADIGRSLRLFVPDEFIQIAEVDGKPAAFIVVLPNLNEIFGQINGRLLPFGWLHLIKQVRNRRITTGRVPLMGVSKRYQNTPLGTALAYQVCDKARWLVLERGITEVEMSWILEDNKSMRGILEALGSLVYKRYRIYAKKL